MIDECFELISLIFRLFPYDFFNGHKESETAYQQKLNTHFATFSTHAAVQFAANNPLGYDAIGHYAMHLRKENDRFALLPDLSCLYKDERWTPDRAAAFLPLVNDFYRDTAFADFFAAHTDYYNEETQKFHAAQYGKIDFPWLEKYTHGKKLHVIFSPSLSNCNYGSAAGNDVYAIVPHNSAVVHEFCHSFGNPLAEKWYTQRAEFREMCDNSVDAKRLPWYANGPTMAREYVTRAYHVLYDMQHGEANLKARLTIERNWHTRNSFPHIAQVYEMVCASNS